MSGRARVAVLVSGAGTNLQALLDGAATRGAPFEVVLVLADRPGIGAIERAERACVPALVLPSRSPRETAEARLAEALTERLGEATVDLVVLAGFLRRVPATVVDRYAGRMINVHPALLPSFGGSGMYGRRVHEAALAAGVTVSGATVHFVDAEYDRGPIIAQWPVAVLDEDDPETLAARVLEVEHALLPRVVRALARGEVRLDAEGRCRWEVPRPTPRLDAEGLEETGDLGLPRQHGG
ncbi:MAG: phosphoribosylglycinamide formyltransferase [Gemmatimonadota bacterium]